jgi:hypothetical protein
MAQFYSELPVVRSANPTEPNIELVSMYASWPGQVRACVLRHAKCGRNQAPAFMATRQGGSDHPMTRTLLQHGALEEGCRRGPSECLANSRCSRFRGQLQWWSEQSTSATSRWPAPCYQIAPRRPRPGALLRNRSTRRPVWLACQLSLAGPRQSAVPRSDEHFPLHPDRRQQDNRGEHFVLRKQRHVDRGCAIQVHGGSWDHLGNDDLSRSKMFG